MLMKKRRRNEGELSETKQGKREIIKLDRKFSGTFFFCDIFLITVCFFLSLVSMQGHHALKRFPTIIKFESKVKERF
jgi:hypothetical protein